MPKTASLVQIDSEGQNEFEDERHRDFAILFGVNVYVAEGMDLTQPVSDVDAVKAWLVQKDGGGLKEDQIYTLRGLERDYRHSNFVGPQGVVLGFAEARKFAERLKEQGKTPRRLYFYFSGHGAHGNDADTVFMFRSDFDNKDNLSALLPTSQVLEYNARCAMFAEVFVWIDCCRDRNVFAIGADHVLGCRVIEGVDSFAFLLFSCRRGLVAYENANGENSLFTTALLKGLDHAADINGLVTVESLEAYVLEYVPILARQQSNIQEPVSTIRRVSANSRIVLKASANPISVTMVFDKDPGTIDVIDAYNNPVVSNYAVIGRQCTFLLKVGRYEILGDHGKHALIQASGLEDSIHVRFD